MRSIWLGQRLEFGFDGKVLDGAIILGDIDNDGESELVVGSLNGDLAVFKGAATWQRLGGLGPISAVAVGDVMNCGSNAVVIIGTDGTCYVYLCLNVGGEKLQVVHKQTLPPNAKFATIGDVIGEGQTCLVIGSTDCALRVYKWVQNPTEACLVCIGETECPSQIGSISVSKDENDKNLIYISQPGLGFLTADFKAKGKIRLLQHTVKTQKAPNVGTPAQLTTPVGKNGSCILAYFDGTVFSVDVDKTVKWSLELEQQTFKCIKIHASTEGGDQVVVAAWNGHTYIINEQGQIVLFELDQAIQNFTAGLYGRRGTTAFVYLTFNNKLIVCYDVMIDHFALKSVSGFQAVDPALSSYSPEQRKNLTQYLLYDFPKKL